MGKIFKTSSKKAELPVGEWKFESRPGGWMIAIGVDSQGKPKRIRFLSTEAKGKIWALLAGTAFTGEVAETASGAKETDDESGLIAQFPGKVRKLLVKVGDRVEKGSPLVLIEAMKMEFSIKAPYAAKVKKLLVSEGQQLSPGDHFVELEK